MRVFAAGLQLRGLGLGTGHPEWGACRSPRLPVWGAPGAVDVCLGREELLRAEMGP